MTIRIMLNYFLSTDFIKNTNMQKIIQGESSNMELEITEKNRKTR